MIFEYKELKRFFKKLNSLGRSQLFKNWKGESVFLLRHDVDLDIKLAHQLAEVEAEMGIVSTFFILTTCDYNILSKHNRSLLIEMKEMGHEIGLHFDPTLYDENLDFHVKKEADILSSVVGEEVCSISLHNPTSHGQYPMFKGYVNAYSSELFNDENYISDSCFSFRGKDPYDFLTRVNKGMVQILLHPMHYSEKGSGYDLILPDVFIRNMRNIHESFYSVNAKYREQVEEDFIKTLKKNLK